MIDLVIMPKASFAEPLWSRSWEDLLSMAARGEQGMRVHQCARGDEPMVRPRDKAGEFIPGWEDWSEIAMFRDGTGHYDRGRAWLFKQNW